MSSRTRLAVGVSVADEAAVDGVGELSFQASQGFPVAFAGGAFALVAGTSGGVVGDLGDGHDVQAAVELAVPAAGQPVAEHHSRDLGRGQRHRRITSRLPQRGVLAGISVSAFAPLSIPAPYAQRVDYERS